MKIDYERPLEGIRLENCKGFVIHPNVVSPRSVFVPPNLTYHKLGKKKFKIEYDEIWKRYFIYRKKWLGYVTASHYAFKDYSDALYYIDRLR